MEPDHIRDATQMVEQPAPAQEPVAWITRRTADGGVYVDGYETCESTDYGAIPVYTTPPAPAQPLPPNCGTGYCSCIECLKGGA